MDTELLVLLIPIALIAAVIQGSAGFGFGLFSVAALNLFVRELQISTPLLTLLNLPVTLYLFIRLRRSVVWPRTLPLLAGMLVGAPIGIYVLVNWDREVLLRILGIVLLAAAARSAMVKSDAGASRGTHRPSLPGKCLGVAVGVAQGALAGAFNTGGPPVIAYVYSRPWTKEERTATLNALFACSLIYRLIIMSLKGLYDAPLVMTGVAAMPAVIVGMLVGYALFRRFPPRALEIFTAVFLLFVGLRMLVSP